MRIQLSNVIKGLPLLLAALVAVSAVTLSSGPVNATGNDSPEDCKTDYKAEAEDAGQSGDKLVFTADEGYVVDGVCIKSGEDSFGDKQHSGVLGNGTTADGCYTVSGVDTRTVTVTRADSNECKDLSHVDVLVQEDENDINYCDPANFPRGSVAENVPKDVNCVEFTVATTCGEVTANIINKTQYNTWAVMYTVGAPDWDAIYSWTKADWQNPDNNLPKTFAEDYNGGSVDVYYSLHGPEKDYVLNRDINNIWEKRAGMVTVNTDCEDSEEPTTPEEETETPVSDPNVLGDTDTRGGQGGLPTSLPVTGANEQLAAIVTIVSTIATAAGVYTLRGRSADLSL